MLRMRHTVTVLFIILIFDNVTSVSVISEKEIGNTTLPELKIRDDIVTGNSSLEAKLSSKIQEELKTTSGASVSSPVIKKEEKSEKTNPTPVRVEHDHDFDSGELRYPSEEIEASDDDVPPTVRVKRSDDDSQYTIDDYADWGYDDEDINAPEQDIGDNVTLDLRHGDIHGIMTSLVRMPTGTARDVKITIPNMTGWEHGIDKTRLINLDPKGKLGGREYKIVEDQMQQTIVTHYKRTFQSYNIIKIEKVVNGFLWKKYIHAKKHVRREAGYANERMLFHGTSHVKEIVEHGFDESYSEGTGMFGSGLYFARHSSKSNQYSFGYLKNCTTHNKVNCDICERKQLLCRVVLGKMKEETEANKRPHAPPDHRSVAGVAVSGGALKYDEYAVYNGEQVYPEYVITYKIVI